MLCPGHPESQVLGRALAQCTNASIPNHVSHAASRGASCPHRLKLAVGLQLLPHHVPTPPTDRKEDAVGRWEMRMEGPASGTEVVGTAPGGLTGAAHPPQALRILVLTVPPTRTEPHIRRYSASVQHTRTETREVNHGLLRTALFLAVLLLLFRI